MASGSTELLPTSPPFQPQQGLVAGLIKSDGNGHPRHEFKCRRIILAEEAVPMSKKAAEHHTKAAEHHTHAAKHHSEAAKHHETGQHEKAAHHAHTASGHGSHARTHAEEAGKAHMEEHGRK
jgi:hypothetical protein